ncbi:MAG: hypothetical protein AABY22_15480 [Nanoarchaeota archaeon]
MDTRIGDISKEGFKVNYKSLKKAIHGCEYKGKESDECKKIMKDLGITVIEYE